MDKRHDEVIELAGIIQNKMRDESYIFSDVAAIDAADEILNLGYHKTIWHKVKDGDLPKENKDYLVILEGNNYNILRYCPYDMEDNDDNMLNLQKGFNAFDREMFEYYTIDRVVAWTELPSCEE